MGRSPSCDSDAGLKNGPWTSEEDKLLVDHIQEKGHDIWRRVPKLAGLNRSGKSCRLRWTNYLRPDIKRGRFTDDEEKLIIHLHSILGNKWLLIANKLPGRTDNEIKNYWYTNISKKLRVNGIDPNTHHPFTHLATEFAELRNLLSADKLAIGGYSGGASASSDMNDYKLHSDATIFQLVQGDCWVSASLGTMRAFLGKLDKLLLAPPRGCSSKRVKDGMCLLKDDVEEISSYLDELSKVENPPPMAKCWMNEARDLSYDQSC